MGRAACLAGIVALVAALGAASSQAGAPAGACTDTMVSRVEPRLQGAPDSGVFVAYADGHTQSSYEVLPGAAHSRPGDPVKLCVVSRPAGCPKGDDRGAVLSAVNGRTGERWTAADSSHRCGGA